MFGLFKKKLKESVEKISNIIKKKEEPEIEEVSDKIEEIIKEETISILEKPIKITEAQEEAVEAYEKEVEEPQDIEIKEELEKECSVCHSKEKIDDSEIKEFLSKFLNENFIKQHVEIVVDEALKLCDHYPEADREIVRIAAWLHDVGHDNRVFNKDKYQTENEHHIVGVERAKEFLESMDYDKEKMQRILHCVEAHRTRKPPEPDTIEAKIVASADNISHFVGFDDLVHGVGDFDTCYSKLERDLKAPFMLFEAIKRAKSLFADIKKPEIKDEIFGEEPVKEIAVSEESIPELKEDEITVDEVITVDEPPKRVVEKVEIREEPIRVEEAPKKKVGLFQRIRKAISEKELTEDDITDILWDLQMTLMQSDVAVDVAEKIINDLRVSLVGKSVEKKKIEDIVRESMKDSITEILDVDTIDLIKIVKTKKPYLIVFLGFNGSGKTTTIARLGYLLKEKGFSVVMAAADTWRAASIEQLEEHGRNLGIGVIKQNYGSDPAAVIFDAVKHAKSKNIDIVLADTAGRSHANLNLIEELKKICRVNTPDMKILVIDALTGNDVVEQTSTFNDAVGVDAMILTKTDVYEKGGAILSSIHNIKKPILYLGYGQEYKDLKPFDINSIIKNLLE